MEYILATRGHGRLASSRRRLCRFTANFSAPMARAAFARPGLGSHGWAARRTFTTESTDCAGEVVVVGAQVGIKPSRLAATPGPRDGAWICCCVLGALVLTRPSWWMGSERVRPAGEMRSRYPSPHSHPAPAGACLAFRPSFTPLTQLRCLSVISLVPRPAGRPAVSHRCCTKPRWTDWWRSRRHRSSRAARRD